MKTFIIILCILVALVAVIILIYMYYRSSESLSTDNFIRWNGEEFILQEKTFYATGCNIPWLGLVVSNYDSGKVSDVKCFTPPTRENIEAILTYAKTQLHCNVVRSHTLGFSSLSPQSLIPEQGRYNNDYWDVIDFTILTAKRLGLYLIPVLSDQYAGYNGNYNVFITPDEQPSDFFDTKSKSFANYKDFLRTYLTHKISGTDSTIADEPTIFCLEFGNELGDHFLDQSAQLCHIDQTINCYYNPTQEPLIMRKTGCSVPTQEWMKAVRDCIRTYDQNHMLMTGADWCQLDDPIYTNACPWNLDGVDIISFHWYFCVTPDSTAFTDKGPFDIELSSYNKAKKAVLFGEFPATYMKVKDFGNQLQQFLDSKKISGALFWDLVYDDYIAGGADITSDGCSAPFGFAVSPNHDQGVLKLYADLFATYSFDIPNQCVPPDLCQCGSSTINILLIGDSITSGFHCSQMRNLCSQCTNCDNFQDCDFSSTCHLVGDKSPGAGACNYSNNCSNSFADFLGQYLSNNNAADQIEIYNHAYPGTTAIRSIDTTSSCSIAYGSYIDNDAYLNECWTKSLQYPSIDFITLMFGTNDAIQANVQSCFGGSSDDLVTAVVHELTYMIDTLRDKYPNAIIFIMRPIPTTNDGTFIDVDIIDNKYTAMSSIQMENIEYIDLYSEIKAAFGNINDLLCDTIHPLNHLNKFIGECIGKRILKHLPSHDKSRNTTTISYTKCDPCNDDYP